MPTVALMDNGEYVMSYEICGRPMCPAHVKTSSDGAEWNAGDRRSAVDTDDALFSGSSPYVVWDPSNKQLVLAGHSIWYTSTVTQAPQHHRAPSCQPKLWPRYLGLGTSSVASQHCVWTLQFGL